MMLEEQVITLCHRPAPVGWGIGSERDIMRQCNMELSAEKSEHCEHEHGYEPDVRLVVSRVVEHGNQFVLRQFNMHTATERDSDEGPAVSSTTSAVSSQSIFLYIRSESSQGDRGAFVQTNKQQLLQGSQDTCGLCDRKWTRFNCTKYSIMHEENERRRVMAESKAFCENFLNFPIKTMATSPRLVVGCALKPKKAESFLKPTLFACARSKGVVISVIDQDKPLLEQGPFDVILHKILGEDWHQQLKAYKRKDPKVFIFDAPSAIMKVYNRMSMLKEVADLKFQQSQVKVDVPKQVVVDVDYASMSEEVTRANLRFPLVAKPLWIDGSAKSHDLSLVFNEFDLSSLTTPLVLQEFVNHGGVMFKVFVIGHLMKVIHRPSLLDVCCSEARGKGVMPFPRISSAAASAAESNQNPSIIEYPPTDLLSLFAKKLSSRLGLSLFNFDVIRETGNDFQYYVIDINYFPGYGKLPDYEEMFTEFLVSIAKKMECK